MREQKSRQLQTKIKILKNRFRNRYKHIQFAESFRYVQMLIVLTTNM